MRGGVFFDGFLAMVAALPVVGRRFFCRIARVVGQAHDLEHGCRFESRSQSQTTAVFALGFAELFEHEGYVSVLRRERAFDPR